MPDRFIQLSILLLFSSFFPSFFLLLYRPIPGVFFKYSVLYNDRNRSVFLNWRTQLDSFTNAILERTSVNSLHSYEALL